MKQLIFLYLIIILTSCKPQAEDSVHNFYVQNNSISNELFLIGFKQVNGLTVRDTINFKNNALFITQTSRHSKNRPAAFQIDSVHVVFNDSVIVNHSGFKNIHNGVSKNLLEDNSWETIRSEDFFYEYKFIFDEKAFQEALRLNGY